MTRPLSPAEQAALDVWNNGSKNTATMLAAVRAALNEAARSVPPVRMAWHDRAPVEEPGITSTADPRALDDGPVRVDSWLTERDVQRP